MHKNYLSAKERPKIPPRVRTFGVTVKDAIERERESSTPTHSSLTLSLLELLNQEEGGGVEKEEKNLEPPSSPKKALLSPLMSKKNPAEPAPLSLDGGASKPALKKKKGFITCPIASSTKERLPVFFRRLIEHIKAKCIKDEGIFRISPTHEKLEKLKRMYDRGENLDFEEAFGGNSHIPCALLKKYLRDLPEPLCTYKLYPKFLAALEMEEKARVPYLKDLIKELDEVHRDCLLAVCELSEAVVAHVETNKMNYTNLGVVFGPCLLVEGRDTVSLSTGDSEMVSIILSNYREIFVDYPLLFTTRKTTTTTSIKSPKENRAKDTNDATPPPPQPSQSSSFSTGDNKAAIVSDDVFSLVGNEEQRRRRRKPKGKKKEEEDEKKKKEKKEKRRKSYKQEKKDKEDKEDKEDTEDKEDKEEKEEKEE
eukprot:CAMPEP_0201534236 /NCGR_PEP_ID=MMETSP0161_2-20130828/55701_1 /ASSEMBLY_ACC=CAM_ASM_000251 /TAXON_ID=180227 /ORGANISM="Neoparamoeba aestuarina, Strain SoJaBio B1-5/56/2" /LENGTH=423 /DNA_ID=CAMNT_0047938767 /DNA_START=1 /DNA_END=1269 /DNA_ORIENTATION=+